MEYIASIHLMFPKKSISLKARSSIYKSALGLPKYN